VAIEAQAVSRELCRLGIAAAYEAVAQVDSLMHPTRLDSDIERMRGSATDVPVRVHPWTFKVLALCQRLHRLSQGVFDPCLPESAGRMTSIELAPPQGVIQRVGVRLDLGGIAKGFAVDRAIEALKHAGCIGGIVNAGGDLAVFGEHHHDIFLRDAKGRVSQITLRDAALATSDTQHEVRPREHRGYYSGVGEPTIVTGRATVMAPSAAIADGLTKCVLAGDGALTPSLLEAFGARRIE
jgi:FAD:protein FMN transferase